MCYTKRHTYACGCVKSSSSYCRYGKSSTECLPAFAMTTTGAEECSPCQLNRGRRVEEIVDKEDIDELSKLMNRKL